MNRAPVETPAEGAHRPPHLGTEKGLHGTAGLRGLRPRQNRTATNVRPSAAYADGTPDTDRSGSRWRQNSAPVGASRAWRTLPASANTAPPPIAGR